MPLNVEDDFVLEGLILDLAKYSSALATFLSSGLIEVRYGFSQLVMSLSTFCLCEAQVLGIETHRWCRLGKISSAKVLVLELKE